MNTEYVETGKLTYLSIDHVVVEVDLMFLILPEIMHEPTAQSLIRL